MSPAVAIIISLAVSVVVALFAGLVAPQMVAARIQRAQDEARKTDMEMRLAERRQDWERQDEVARRAQQQADKVVAGQKAASEELARSQKQIADQAAEAASLLLKNNERVAATQDETNGRLDVIHTLVNSNMTAEMQARFDATKRELAVMRELMAIKQAGGLEPTPEVLAAIESTQTTLHELDAALADRRRAQDKITSAHGIVTGSVTTTTTMRGAQGDQG